ncbi:MAG: Mrp/NBP35 family ATP-binding protein [Prolixibacteraceae bacterium]|jgi:ATP-binding protein involved in chromosome partitioning|nr:Mrp/NBP35 family ATP-binding protein [Prolixibacteraceae bacterium]
MQEHKTIEKIKMPGIREIIIVASGKGGVGKSTVAAGLAMSLGMEGYSVGLLDADIYGPSVPTLFNLGNEHPKATQQDGKTRIEPFVRFGIKIMSIGFFIQPEQAVLWRGPLVSNTLKQLLDDTNWGDLDYLIIDTPPGTGDTHLTLLQQYEISGAIIVTTPQKIALSDVQKAINMFQNEHVGAPVLGIVENMAWFSPSGHPDEKYYLFGQGGGETLSHTFHIPLIARIPVNETICRSCDEGKLNELFNNQEVKNGFENLLTGILNKGEIAVH